MESTPTTVSATADELELSHRLARCDVIRHLSRPLAHQAGGDVAAACPAVENVEATRAKTPSNLAPLGSILLRGRLDGESNLWQASDLFGLLGSEVEHRVLSPGAFTSANIFAFLP